MSLYSVEEDTPDPGRGWVAPLSFKEFLRMLLCHDFWCDEVVLYAISCMWSVKITSLEYQDPAGVLHTSRLLTGQCGCGCDL